MLRYMLSVAQSLIVRFVRSTRGNMTITFAFSAIPILFAVGAAADYGFAVKTRARMNAAADAATLSAVTPQMMTKSTTVAQTEAVAMFASQVSGLPRLNFNALSVSSTCTSGTNGYLPPTGFALCVQVIDGNVNNQRVRTATVAYQATSQTAFSNIIKMNTIAIGGTSTATAGTSPNIDFYLMLDTSPSMAIPSSTDGIAWMVGHTPNACAFACHEKYPANDGLGAIDNYQRARTGGITLRMDLVTQAVSNLVTTAQSTSSATGAAYRLAGYTFDVATAQAFPIQKPTAATQTAAAAISMLQVDYENVLNGSNNNDMDTNFDTAFTKINAAMTAAGAGTGTNASGDKPQQVLMIVTDGVADENWNSQRIYLPLGGTTSRSAMSTDWCTTIKNTANVRIAVLYLTYNPMTTNAWYNTYVAPEQPEIGQTLQNCASPGLYFKVDTNGDVSSAMSTLFASAVKSARLSN